MGRWPMITRRSVRRGWVRGAHRGGDWLGGRQRQASAGFGVPIEVVIGLADGSGKQALGSRRASRRRLAWQTGAASKRWAAAQRSRYPPAARRCRSSSRSALPFRLGIGVPLRLPNTCIIAFFMLRSITMGAFLMSVDMVATLFLLIQSPDARMRCLQRARHVLISPYGVGP